MYSIAWPEMVSNVNANLVQDREATLSNLKLLLLSNKTGLLGDPYFGSNIRKLMFEQNNQVIQDLVIDDIYTAILTFMPQLLLKRNDIKIISQNETITVTIKALNMIDYQTNLYNITLTENEEI